MVPLPSPFVNQINKGRAYLIFACYTCAPVRAYIRVQVHTRLRYFNVKYINIIYKYIKLEVLKYQTLHEVKSKSVNVCEQIYDK